MTGIHLSIFMASIYVVINVWQAAEVLSDDSGIKKICFRNQILGWISIVALLLYSGCFK